MTDGEISAGLLEKLKTYKPSQATVELIRSTPIVFLVGPTGAGKDALKQKLLATGKYHHIVSHTTRKPRINKGVLEQDGKEYHFISLTEAEKMLDTQAFVEAKLYSNNIYGTSAAEIQQAHKDGKIAITDIEVQGIAEYKAIDPRIMAVFVLPPNFAIWQERLQRRYGDVVDLADVQRRMQTALDEIDQLFATSYYMCLVNDSLPQAVIETEAIASSGQHDPDQETHARAAAHRLYEAIQKYIAR